MSARDRGNKSDLSRVHATREKEIDYRDIPEVMPEQFARAVVHQGLPVRPRKEFVSLRIDADVLE